LKTGDTPWLGHDPSPWVETRDDLIRIWSNGGLDGSVEKAFYVDVSRSAFRKELEKVEQDLQAFLFCLEIWAQNMEIGQSNELAEKFAECFDIQRGDFTYRFQSFSDTRQHFNLHRSFIVGNPIVGFEFLCWHTFLIWYTRDYSNH
jgi:hypothetical protein